MITHRRLLLDYSHRVRNVVNSNNTGTKQNWKKECEETFQINIGVRLLAKDSLQM